MVAVTARHFQSNLDHLLAELALLEMRLSREVGRLRLQLEGGLQSEFRGLLVSDERVDAVLSSAPLDGPEEDRPSDPTLSQIQQRQADIAASCTASKEKGVVLNLEMLRDLYSLGEWDTRVVVLCLAPELDLRFETLYSYIQDDVGKKRPTVDLAISLFADGQADRLAKRRYLLEESPLMKYELVQVVEEPYGKDSPFLARSLKLDPHLTEYLLGSTALDSRLKSWARLVPPGCSWEQVILPGPTKLRLQSLAEKLQSGPTPPSALLLHLVGPTGTGKTTVSAAICNTLRRPLLLVDSAGITSSEVSASQFVNLVFKEARLFNAIPCWDNFHLLSGSDPQQRAALMAVMEAFKEYTGLGILAGTVLWHPERGSADLTLLTVELPAPEYQQRRMLWERHLKGQPGSLTSEEIASLSNKFRLNGGQIQRAVATARDLALWSSPEQRDITAEELNWASRWHSSQQLGRLAQRIYPRYCWEDIVLPGDQKAQLQEVCGFFKTQDVVYEEWGFQNKTSLGKGLNVLFAGPSGTGKTMAAEIMAGELSLDIYRIDLSTVVSKYIGETEKNLDRIFHEAQDSNAILLFDEADALFGKRSEVRDSHDRYANIEISYLLQKMEEYAGISILTTNFRKNIDDAFVRRLHFAVEFPFPDEEHRLQIWQRSFPSQAPIDDTVDLSFMARQFRIAGGNIKNIAVAAAFLAAQNRTSIGMEQLMWATKREYQKMGKLLVETDFGQYFPLVKWETLQEVRDA